ncbi:hypothetical protein JG687_00003747 [Phytophthora cactorum]|uniref:Uncharacterized protein n=1 Tax=Phytophthora cactorum TaxID=29920 RepID=A0A8T1UTJ1_9STRA|nr:hypothetical protein JG687_00003747 [Phytophthora cactorum]
MTELPIQISRLPVPPSVSSISSSSSSSKPVNPTANATGGVGFKLSLLTRGMPSLHCCLVFSNFYVAWIRIVQVNVDGSSTELATAYPLMQHVHCEDDAQDWQIVKLNQLPPSPFWETWELRDVKLYVLPQESGSGAEESIAATRLGTEAPLKLENASRMDPGVNSAVEQATRCLDLVLRLRELLQYKQE